MKWHTPTALCLSWSWEKMPLPGEWGHGLRDGRWAHLCHLPNGHLGPHRCECEERM